MEINVLELCSPPLIFLAFLPFISTLPVRWDFVSKAHAGFFQNSTMMLKHFAHQPPPLHILQTPSIYTVPIDQMRPLVGSPAAVAHLLQEV
ncbi:G-protein coupled receptor [Sarotherodon galilaeus]